MREPSERIFIVSAGIAGTSRDAADLSSFSTEARYRKATRNMVLANTSVERALANIPSDISNRCGYVLGSGHGELSVTVEFLKTLNQMGTARPILFQNSLHNSTTGFIAMTWKMTGPTLTVSNLCFSGEDALETGMQWLQGSINHCLVTGVEAHLPLADDFKGTRLEPLYRYEGAASVLLCNESGLKEYREYEFDPQPLGELVSIERFFPQNSDTSTSGHIEPTTQSWNAVEDLATALNRSIPVPTPATATTLSPPPHPRSYPTPMPMYELILRKSTGATTVLKWRR